MNAKLDVANQCHRISEISSGKISDIYQDSEYYLMCSVRQRMWGEYPIRDSKSKANLGNSMLR